jgi:hypothetical protein
LKFSNTSHYMCVNNEFFKFISQLWFHIAKFLLQFQINIQMCISWYHIQCLGNAYYSFYIVRKAQVIFTVGVALYVTKVPLRDFDVHWKQYYKAYEIEKYPFVVLTCGITSIQYFCNVFPLIFFLENSRLSTSFVYGSD